MIFELFTSFILLMGQASYYSTTGCIGCSKTLTMANGQRLNDSALTLALSPGMVRKYKLLNKFVLVNNPKTNLTVKAKVTDTRGFERYNRVADLTVATRDAIGCENLCKVNILFKK